MPSASTKSRRPRPMNVYVHRGSAAERKYRAVAGVPGLMPEESVQGLPSTPTHDLLFHGGKTIRNLTYTNFYVGADAWDQSDIQNIDRALDAAMSEPTLNNVMAQYFTGVPTTKFVASKMLAGAAPDQVTKEDVEQLVNTLHGQGKLSGLDFSSTVFNFMLPRGTVLVDDPTAGETKGGHSGSAVPLAMRTTRPVRSKDWADFTAPSRSAAPRSTMPSGCFLRQTAVRATEFRCSTPLGRMSWRPSIMS